MSFEVLDNFFQVAVLGGAAGAAAVLFLRRQQRRFLILAFSYACFAMGTLFYVLHLVITGTVPQIFYVAEVSWLASYLFLLLLQILRAHARPPHLYVSACALALLAAALIVLFHIFGPSYLVSVLFALTAGALVYLSVCGLRGSAAHSRRTAYRPDAAHCTGPAPRPRRAPCPLDLLLTVIVFLQAGLYIVSDFTREYTRFNLYFAVDLALTGCLAALLPVTLREAHGK